MANRLGMVLLPHTPYTYTDTTHSKREESADEDMMTNEKGVVDFKAVSSGSIEYMLIQKEIQATERLWQEHQQELQIRHQDTESTTSARDIHHGDSRDNLTVQQRLQRMACQANDLKFAHDMAQYYIHQQHELEVRDSRTKQGNSDSGTSEEEECRGWARMQALGSLLLRHAVLGHSIPAYQTLYRDEFVPLALWLRQKVQGKLRHCLVRIQYPTCGTDNAWEEPVDEEVDEGNERKGSNTSGRVAAVQRTANMLYGITALQREVAQQSLQIDRTIVTGTTTSTTSSSMNELDDPVLQELCRPIVERVCFHFLPSRQNNHSIQMNRIRPVAEAASSVSQRIDRLPEWLLGYMREQVFQPNGPYEWIIHYGILDSKQQQHEPRQENSQDWQAVASTTLTAAKNASWTDFVNEMVRLVQFVLAERNFFRDPLVCGPSSQPMVLCRAVEELLQFDSFLQNDIVVLEEYSDTKQTTSSTSSPLSRHRFVSLVDVCIAGDEELFEWWLERERESVLNTLYDKDAIVASSPMHEPQQVDMHNRVSPRAELFCALIRSIRNKAAVFTFSVPYLARVAVPLCMSFLDALHETATDLTRQLTGRSQLRNKNTLPTNSELGAIVVSWIELLNGATMAAKSLVSPASASFESSPPLSPVNQSDDDLARLGRSLERLQGVMLDEFISAVVEILLMERAKFAGYLMRCSYLLASDDDDVANLSHISPDLCDTQRILAVIMRLCDHVDYNDVALSASLRIYATHIMRERLLSSISEKLLEVAIDLQGMTPDLRRPGCVLFSRDVHAIFSDCQHLPDHALRVLDVCKLMAMESPKLCAIGRSLCELADRPAPLNEAIFEVDDKLFDEAVSMIRAKGLIYLELSDTFAVLNRRRDL